MALNIGSLVGQIRADDSGWRHGLQEAQLRLAGFTRMADGTLRDMHGNVVSQSDAMGRTLGARIGRGARQAVDALKKVAPAAAGIGAGVPAVAGLTAALGGLAAGAVAAGIAVRAFQLAAKPQLESVTEAADAAAKAEEAHEKVLLKKQLAAQLAAQGGEEYERALRDVESAQRAATEADAAAEAQLKGLPPATRATAVAFAGLKNDYESWSDSLASTTMPVFTKGIEILRGLLPQLTPFVKAAAAALGEMLDRVAVGVKSARFKEWAADMAAASGAGLKNFITVIGNLGKGFMGLLHAFLPASSGVTGGLVSMTGAFAAWGTSLNSSEGFAEFVDLAKDGARMLGVLAQAALKVLVNLSPLIGITAQLAEWFAELIGSMDPGVLAAIGTAWAGIVAAIKLYALYGRIAAAVTRMWAIAVGIFNAVMAMNPIVLVIALIVALVAAIVIAYQKSETFRQIVQAAWNAVKLAISLAVDGIIAAISWFAGLPDKIAGWFGDAKDWAVRKSTELVLWMAGLPGRIWKAISSLGSRLTKAAIEAFQRFRSAAIRRAAEFIVWVQGLPGRIGRAIGNLGSLLFNKGMDIVQGLWNGIKSMGSWLKSTLMNWARNLIPGPIAKALGIASPSRVMAQQVGRWIPAGVVEGIKAGSPAVDRAMSGLVNPSSTGIGVGGGIGGGGGGRLKIEVISRPRGNASRLETVLTAALRHEVRVQGGGNVQTFLGNGKG